MEGWVKREKKSIQFQAIYGNIQQYMAIYGSLPGTVWYNLVISKMDIEKGSARLIYTIVYSKIGG